MCVKPIHPEGGDESKDLAGVIQGWSEQCFHIKPMKITIIDQNFNILSSIPRQPNDTEFWEIQAISPDGTYITLTKLFRPAEGTTGSYDANLEVYLWDTVTKQKVKLPITFSLHTKPFWTADSKKIIYIRQHVIERDYLSDSGDLYLYDIESKKEIRLTNSGDFEPFYTSF